MAYACINLHTLGRDARLTHLSYRLLSTKQCNFIKILITFFFKITYIQRMICPFCKNDNDKVVDSRVSGSSIRRRRECCACGRRFTTREYVEVQQLTVIKRSGEREPFQREKLLRGIMNSCKKRPVSIDDIEQLVTRVENALQTSENSEVSYDQIGNLVMQELKKLDAVAYVRFASIYREFKEVGEFVDQIKTLDK